MVPIAMLACHVTGTLINAGGILLGGCLGLLLRRDPTPRLQWPLRLILILLVLYGGFGLMASGLAGGWSGGLGQLLLVFLATVMGNFLGAWLGIQKGMNRMAVHSREQLALAPEERRWDTGFLMASGLYCLTPLAFLGSITEGITGEWLPLAVKTVMDGMATLSFARSFGPSVLLSVLPVLTMQGTITLLCTRLASSPDPTPLTGSMAMTSGWILLGVIPVLFGVRQVRLGNYLPALLIAPLLAQLWWPRS